jgi:signal transduction histidine kinase
MALDKKLDTQVVLDGLGQGILIFDSGGRMIFDNVAVRSILGTDLAVIRSEGWKAAAVLFNTRLPNPDENLDAVRKKALESTRPVRFHIFRSGEYVPCWAAALQGEGGEVFTMLTLDLPDWTALTQLVDRFRHEIGDAVEATQGHIDLITHTMNSQKDPAAEALAKRLGGFTRIISTHMHRSKHLMEMFERLENIRTGKLVEIIRERRRKIDLANFMEDFVEELDEIMLVDPETEARNHRARLTTSIPEGLAVRASSQYLTRILHDILRNAIMYSLIGTPIKIVAQAATNNLSVQLDLIDEGYGIREKEAERVFMPFYRARQPQIMGEFGYGLSLYLCKYEVEAMNGRLWFRSEESVGTTFSIMLPAWRDDSSSTSETKAITS